MTMLDEGLDGDDSVSELVTLTCAGCLNTAIARVTLAMLDLPRPTCNSCGATLVPYLESFRREPSFRAADCTIFPSAAKGMVETAYISAKNEVVPSTVADYAGKMIAHQWINATEQMGGNLCPLLLVKGRLLLGVQRLMAAVEANYTITNYTAEVF